MSARGTSAASPWGGRCSQVQRDLPRPAAPAQAGLHERPSVHRQRRSLLRRVTLHRRTLGKTVSSFALGRRLQRCRYVTAITPRDLRLRAGPGYDSRREWDRNGLLLQRALPTSPIRTSGSVDCRPWIDSNEPRQADPADAEQSLCSRRVACPSRSVGLLSAGRLRILSTACGKLRLDERNGAQSLQAESRSALSSGSTSRRRVRWARGAHGAGRGHGWVVDNAAPVRRSGRA